MYILKEKRRYGYDTVTVSWGSAIQNASKIDVRCCKVAGGVCAVLHLTYTIPGRNSGAAVAPHV